MVRACIWGDVEAVTSAPPEMANVVIRGYLTPLGMAAVYDRPHLMRQLLAMGADPLIGSRINPLEWACRRGWTDVIHTLGACYPGVIDRRNGDGNTALWECCRHQLYAEAALLLQYDPDASLCGRDGTLPHEHVVDIRHETLGSRLRLSAVENTRRKKLMLLRAHMTSRVVALPAQGDVENVPEAVLRLAVTGLNRDLLVTLVHEFM
jgi:ankyrin repeat protein